MDLLVPQRLGQMLFLIFMGAFSVECQTLVVSLVTGDVDHWCKPPIHLNISAADWKNVAIPIETDGSFSSCRVYERCKTPTHLRDSDDYQKDDSAPAETGWWYNRCFNVSELQGANDNRDALCDAWDYDPNTAETSAISSWNLVCDRRLAPAGLVTLQNIGAVVALIVTGAFVDYVSRSAVLLGSYAAVAISTVSLLLAALATARESPRWLIAKGRLDEAEAVMMEAAEANKFQLALTACLVEKLREHTDNRVYQEYDNREEDLLDARSLRRRALVMCGVCFSISFVFHVGALSTVEYNEFWIVCFTVIVTLLTYVVMHFLIAGVTLVMVLSTCFLLAGCIQCALSVAVGTGPGMATKILLVLSKGVSDVILVHCFTYVLELFPSAVRAGVACWAFACGRVAAICAVVILVLRPVGHEDVFFAATGLVLFVTLLFIRALPRTTVVEEARIVARRASASSRIAMQHMKRTLERRTPNDLSAVHSRDSSVSMSRKGRRSVGNISPRSSYTSRRSGSARAPQ
ncbi:hypothetical protein MRX96_024222 [Rhipicephalus microplus]